MQRLIPRVFHFVYGLKPQSEPFPLLHFLCLKSCIRVNRPERVEFHTWRRPWGPWWERIEPELHVRSIEPCRFIEESTAYANHDEGGIIRRLGLEYAHHADFIRLEILLERGGVYADIDTLFVEPIPESYYRCEFVLAPEGFTATAPDGSRVATLCNALMMSRVESDFAQAWYERMYAVFDGTWNRHSCLEASLAARDMPGSITIAPQSLFFPVTPTAEGIARLFAPSRDTLEGASSVHLWEHLWSHAERLDFSRMHAGMVTTDYVAAGRSLYARLAAPFLDPGV